MKNSLKRTESAFDSLEYARNTLQVHHRAKILDFGKALFPRVSLFWKATLLYWCVFGLISFSIRFFMGQSWAQALAFFLLLEACVLVLSQALRILYRRTEQNFGLRTALLVNVAGIAAAIVQGAVVMGFSLATGWHNEMSDFLVNTTLRLMIMSCAFIIWSLGYYWLESDLERSNESSLKEESQREAQRIELQMLRAQLDPHFLFNSLNGIAAEIRSHPDAASEMVLELSDYLRYSLEHRNKATGRLSAEIDAMRAYLKIQQARFSTRLHFSVHADAVSSQRTVPGFILQPLIENAVKHSLERSTEITKICITSAAHGDKLTIEVTNTGQLHPSMRTEADGLGLETLRRRLNLHYPDRHSFTLEDGESCVHATLRLQGDPCCV